MPKNKEGKTEEERLALLQQRALVEEEMKRKKEEIFSLFLQDKLMKEQRNSSVNQLKLGDGWRSLLRLTRAAELKERVTELQHSFGRRLDGRDRVVQTLGRDLQEAELQSAQVRRVHLQKAELLFSLQRERVTSLQQLWERELQQLSRRCCQEGKQVSGRVVQRQADLDDATLTVEQQHRVATNEVHRLYSECITAYQTSHDGRKDALTYQDQDRLRKETQENREAQQVCDTESLKLTDLLMETQQLIQETGREAQAARALQRKVVLQRSTVVASEIDDRKAERDLMEARRLMSARTRSLREQLLQDRAEARKRLTALTVQSAAAAKKLEAAAAKGLKVLRVAEMCRKLERQNDVTVDLEREEAGEDTSALQQVRKRMNASVLRQEALRRRRDALREDNRQLKLLLRQRLDAMTLSDRDLGARHALLTVHRAPTAGHAAGPTAAGPTAAGPVRHNVIEAAHAVKHSL
ncbi:dynein regulatory complex subunit 2 [Clinocottus analis]|uniref:dynein regulatory complex subunit 2 n=1 Tax=Clinocottus analis TaxID=304258 RepID=UPI0035BF1AAA